MVDRDFVVNAIASGFSASTIIKNPTTAVGCASCLGNWPAVTRYVEMCRAAETYQGDQFESAIVGHMDVIGSLLGTDILAERMLLDGHPTMAARSGIQVCAALDACGSIAPWREYMLAFAKESKEDNTIYDQESDWKTNVAWLRGCLRLASLKRGADAVSSRGVSASDFSADRDYDLYAPLNWNELARLLDADSLPAAEVIRAIVDTFGLSAVVELIGKLDQPSIVCLALAEEIAAGTAPDSEGSALYWASRAVDCSLPPGSAPRLIAIGLDVDEIDARPVRAARERLLSLVTRI